MKPFLILYLGTILFFSCGESKTENVDLVGNLSSEVPQYQDRIVGQLSGHYPLSDGSVIRSRWSKVERQQSKDYLVDLINTLGIEPQTHSYRMANLNPAIDLILQPYRGTNVYGVLPSTSGSSEYIVLGAHYDSGKRNAPGAIDNATGIALIYSIVKEWSKETIRDKNLMLVFFDQEEEELIGSKAFAKFMVDQSYDVHSVHCFDMVGWDGDNDRAMEVYSASEGLLKIYRESAVDMDIPLNVIVINPVGYHKNATDFDAFVPHGFNAIGAGECYYHGDYSPYKDTPDDTYDTVDFDYLRSCTEFIATVVNKCMQP